MYRSLDSPVVNVLPHLPFLLCVVGNNMIIYTSYKHTFFPPHSIMPFLDVFFSIQDSVRNHTLRLVIVSFSDL